MKSIKDCQFSAFISYAHDDDCAQFDWITSFCNELNTRLPARLRGLRAPGVHRSQLNGPTRGVLDAELRRRIEDSFAMIIVVHQNYAQSDWCLKELEHFRSIFGEQGFRERLYIVALSKTWIETVAQSPGWKSQLPEDQIWMPFFADDDHEQPVEIYSRKGVVSAEFKAPFERLLDDLVGQITRPAPPPAAVSPAAPLPAQPAQARTLIGLATPELGAPVQAVAAALGMPTRTLGEDSLRSGLPEFALAEMLVLPFNDSQPLLPFIPGGHLALQHDAWFKTNKPKGSLVWLDLRHIAAATPASAEHAAYIAEHAAESIKPEALHARLPAPAPMQDSVRIYIESNQHERELWEPLGEQIAEQWDAIVKNERLAPPLYVRTRGLPVDYLDQYPNLDDADGVVLLWGKKEPQALISQINKVENKLSGRDLAPGIVAYLMPPQPAPQSPMPAWGWKVLRFDVAQDVVKPADDLQDFLRKILKRTTRRRATAVAAVAPAPAVLSAVPWLVSGAATAAG